MQPFPVLNHDASIPYNQAILRVEREELARVPCLGEGAYASCPKIRRAVEAGSKISDLEDRVTTLSLEVEVQQSSLVQIATPSSQLTRTLRGCERGRAKLEQERLRYEELRAIEARRDERLKTFDHLSQNRGEIAEELAGKEVAMSAFADLGARMNAVRRETEDANHQLISCRAERDRLIAYRAQIKQRQEQKKAARARLAEIEQELGNAKTELEDYNYLQEPLALMKSSFVRFGSPGQSKSASKSANKRTRMDPADSSARITKARLGA